MQEMDYYYRNFCKELVAWLDGGEKPEWFNKNAGICYNFSEYLLEHDVTIQDGYDYINDLLGGSLPFNFGSSVRYKREIDDGSLYKNPARIAHIREYAK